MEVVFINESGLKEQGCLKFFSLVLKRRSAIDKTYAFIFDDKKDQC